MILALIPTATCSSVIGETVQCALERVAAYPVDSVAAAAAAAAACKGVGECMFVVGAWVVALADEEGQHWLMPMMLAGEWHVLRPARMQDCWCWCLSQR